MANQIAREKYMPIAIEQTIQALQIMVQSVPVGTNLALLHLQGIAIAMFIAGLAFISRHKAHEYKII